MARGVGATPHPLPIRAQGRPFLTCPCGWYAARMSEAPSPRNDVPEVLFVCVRNAGRSQMAAAFLEAKARGRIRVRSAGSAPGERGQSVGPSP